MAKYQPMVEETTETTGTNTLILGGATTNHRSFASAFTEDDYVPYLLRSADGTKIEWGYGKANDLAGTPELERSFVHGSTNSGNKIVLPAGEHIVRCGVLPDIRERHGFLVSSPSTSVTPTDYDMATGVEETVYWNECEWYTDDLFVHVGAISPQTDFLIPAWVDKINLVCGIGYYTSGVTDPGGDRRIKIESLDETWTDGYPWSHIPGAASVYHAHSVVGLNLAMVGTPTNRGFKVKAMQDSGQTLKLSANDAITWLHVEFVE